MKVLLALIFFFSVASSFALDDAPPSAFHKGNVYYEQGLYDEAIRQYGSVLEGGLESGSLYYNLGNCYFKKGKLGEAVLYYEKARRLIGLDKDLEANYEYACSLIKGSGVVSKKSWFVKGLDRLFDKFTIDGLTVVLSVLYILILSVILSGVLFSAVKKYALASAVFLGLFFIIGFAGLKEKVSGVGKEAVVTAENVDARFEPIDKATVHFTLYEGMKVEVIDSRDNWYKVRRQDNKSGWVQGAALAIF